MNEAQEILINSLTSFGISLPIQISTFKDLTPDLLLSICAQSLHQIDNSISFPTSLPDSMAERFKICTDISSAIKSLGYRRDLSFHQFLYPSEEDSYKLVRFLVEKLSETSNDGKLAENETVPLLRVEEDQSGDTSRNDGPGLDQDSQTFRTRLEELRLKDENPESIIIGKEVSINSPADACLVMQQNDEPVVIESSAQKNDVHVTELQHKLDYLQEQSSMLRVRIEDVRSQERKLATELKEKTSESQDLEVEHEMLRKVVGMTLDDQHPVNVYIEELNTQVEERKRNLVELEIQSNAIEKSLLEKKRSLEESFYAQCPELKEKLQKMKEIELERETIRLEIQEREKEHSRLSVELKNQQKVAPRKSYIQRITEITKNSRKQDADIERILKDTRELQIESNSIQERLHRTYAIVDETVSRDAKKDPVRRQAYMLLTSIHESFDLLSQKILTTDRARREATEQEVKLSKMASRSLNIDKLQADLEAIKRENEFLEQQHRQK